MSEFINKVGNRYGNLLVKEHIGFTKNKNALFKCLCDCGNECEVPSGQLRWPKYHTISCGCVRYMNRLNYIGLHKDLSGKKFGRLEVLEEKCLLFDKDHEYLCRCECGNEKIISADDLRRGKVLSCGCYLSEKSRETMKKLPRKSGKLCKKHEST